MHPLLKSLSYGDKRMVKGVEDVVVLVKKDPSLFSILINGISSNNELIAMRSADAIEKLTTNYPEWLNPHKNRLIELISQADQQEVRWHLCQIVPRIPLSKRERKDLIKLFQRFLTDKSRIVVTFTMQALTDLAGNDKEIIQEVFPIIKDLTEWAELLIEANY